MSNEDSKFKEPLPRFKIITLEQCDECATDEYDKIDRDYKDNSLCMYCGCKIYEE